MTASSTAPISVTFAGVYKKEIEKLDIFKKNAVHYSIMWELIIVFLIIGFTGVAIYLINCLWALITL